MALYYSYYFSQGPLTSDRSAQVSDQTSTGGSNTTAINGGETRAASSLKPNCAKPDNTIKGKTAEFYLCPEIQVRAKVEHLAKFFQIRHTTRRPLGEISLPICQFLPLHAFLDISPILYTLDYLEALVLCFFQVEIFTGVAACLLIAQFVV